MDKSIKLAQVRKSCNILEIVFKIIKIICIAAAGICLVASIVFAIFGNRIVSFRNGNPEERLSNINFNVDFFDNEILSLENGRLSGPLGPIVKRAIEEAIADESGINSRIHLDGVFEGEYGPEAVGVLNAYVRWGTFAGLIFAAGMCCVVAVIFWLVEGIFKKIKESDSPFTEEILKKLRIVFIVISILALLTNGIWSGAIVGLLCWAVYCIIDYGYALQSEVDETL
ncbi:MAG: hypothetical protein K6E39_00565 [Lachnospiraceae bacterium]|nr:hypothetical protein [Lachnospiraceae bacterium]